MSSDIMNHTTENLKAWVVFSGHADLSWLKLLKPGFRHCSVLLHDGYKWCSVDPMLQHTDIAVHHNVSSDFDMPAWLRGRGHKVIEAPVQRIKCKPAPFMMFTCVEAVKRILGYHAMRVVTPWQLYKHLRKINTSSFNRKGDYAWEV